MAFLGPVATATGGTAARLLGSRVLGAAATRLGATRLGAGALSRTSIMSAVQFGARAGMLSGGSGGEASNQTSRPAPGPVQVG